MPIRSGIAKLRVPEIIGGSANIGNKPGTLTGRVGIPARVILLGPQKAIRRVQNLGYFGDSYELSIQVLIFRPATCPLPNSCSRRRPWSGALAARIRGGLPQVRRAVLGIDIGGILIEATDPIAPVQVKQMQCLAAKGVPGAPGGRVVGA